MAECKVEGTETDEADDRSAFPVETLELATEGPLVRVGDWKW